MPSRTSELLGLQRDAKRHLAMRLWKDSFALERQAGQQRCPAVADLLHGESGRTLRRAKLLYDAAEQEVIPELSDN